MSKNKLAESQVLPEFPRTRHLPWNPNSTPGDLIAFEQDAAVVFESDAVSITEKIDGANCGMALVNNEPVIRNHNHILRKGYVKETPAKKQFASIFNWFYEHKDKFEALNDSAGNVSVYGEWMYAQHGLEYDLLPSLFIAFDLFDWGSQRFIASHLARQLLTEAGFNIVPELHYGKVDDIEIFNRLANQPSPFTTKGLREGIYIKVNGPRWVEQRFKLVRQGFVQGGLWDTKQIKKNKVLGK